MSTLPPRQSYINFKPDPEAVEEVANWLRRRYPKHSDRNPLNWYDAFLVLEVSEITVRGYVQKGILEDLTIPSLALFIAKRDILWEQYGRPDEQEEYEFNRKITLLHDELDYWKEKNGKTIKTLTS